MPPKSNGRGGSKGRSGQAASQPVPLASARVASSGKEVSRKRTSTSQLQSNNKKAAMFESVLLSRGESCESLSGAISDASGVVSDTDASSSVVSLRVSPSDSTIPSSCRSPSTQPQPSGSACPSSSSCNVLPLSTSRSTSELPVSPSRTARISLDASFPLPETTRQVFVVSNDSSRKLTYLNPCTLKSDIDAACGQVSKVTYMQNGTLLVTAYTLEQVQQLLQTTFFPTAKLSITVKVAWTQQFTYGKLYAPPLAHESLDTILEYLSPMNVVAVRKMFADPRNTTPLYVITFLGPVPPKITLGYMSYTIDKYVSRPLRCFNCWRLRHSTASCRSRANCSNCTSFDHSADQCQSERPQCVNCRGCHSSTSVDCPMYCRELSICGLQADLGISFIEARTRLQDSPRPVPNSLSPTPTVPTVVFPNSQHDFPALPSSQSLSSSVLPPYQQPSTFSQVASQLPSSGHVQSSSASQQSLSVQSPYSNPGNLSQLSLPELPPLSSLSTARPCTNPPSKPACVPHSSADPRMFLPPSFISLFPKIIPILIRLFFATAKTDKIECLTELGDLFQISSIVSSVLTSLNVSSHSQ